MNVSALASCDAAERRLLLSGQGNRMVLPLVISLAIVLGFGLVWNLRERRGGAA